MIARLDAPRQPTARQNACTGRPQAEMTKRSRLRGKHWFSECLASGLERQPPLGCSVISPACSKRDLKHGPVVTRCCLMAGFASGRGAPRGSRLSDRIPQPKSGNLTHGKAYRPPNQMGAEAHARKRFLHSIETWGASGHYILAKPVQATEAGQPLRGRVLLDMPSG